MLLWGMGMRSSLMKSSKKGNSVSDVRLQMEVDCSSRHVIKVLSLPLVRLTKIPLQ